MQDHSSNSLIDSIASSQISGTSTKLPLFTLFLAPKNLKISPKGELRKLRPGAPGSHRLGNNVDEASGDDESEPTKKSKVE